MPKKKVNKAWAGAYGDILKQIFNLYNIDNSEFAEEIGISEEAIRQWFTGRGFPDIANMPKLYEGIKIRANEISNPTLDTEMSDFIVGRLAPLGCVCKHISLSKDDMGQYLINKLRICFARGKQPMKENSIEIVSSYKPTGKIQAVIFDFDGTLTDVRTGLNANRNTAQTTWESIWVELGYTVQDCRDLHKRFDRNEIKHEEWCSITEKKFKERKLHKDTLLKIAKNIKLLDGCKEMFLALYDRNINFYIVSGSILIIIQEVLNDIYRYVDDVKANDFKFSTDGFLTNIIGTEYDFDGKAKFIQDICIKLKASPKDILFVGNSHNDEHAYLSGANTLCINPILTSSTNTKIWHDYIQDCVSLTDVLEYIKRLEERFTLVGS